MFGCSSEAARRQSRASAAGTRGRRAARARAPSAPRRGSGRAASRGRRRPSRPSRARTRGGSRRGRCRCRGSSTSVARTCSLRQRSIFPWSPESSTSGTRPAAELRRTRVVRVLELAVEVDRERLELARALGQRAGQAARDRVDEHHRRQVAVREHVRPDRDRVGAEVLDDALVEALEARGEQRQPLLLRELLDDRLRQLPALRRQRDHADGRAAPP